MSDLRELLHSDVDRAIAQVETGTPQEIAERYEKAHHQLYWKHKDLPALVALARAGIRYCLASPELRHGAKHLAYDTGSFTWPGWEEPGIAPSPDDLEYGRQCAALNLQLAIEQNRPPLGHSKAHWLIGAHALAASDPQTAEHHFKLAISTLAPDEANAEKFAPLNNGNVAIAQLAQDPANKSAAEAFTAAVAQLESQDDEESESFLQQLQAARRLFVK